VEEKACRDDGAAGKWTEMKIGIIDGTKGDANNEASRVSREDLYKYAFGDTIREQTNQ
jgi:hypothetical protein